MVRSGSRSEAPKPRTPHRRRVARGRRPDPGAGRGAGLRDARRLAALGRREPWQHPGARHALRPLRALLHQDRQGKGLKVAAHARKLIKTTVSAAVLAENRPNLQNVARKIGGTLSADAHHMTRTSNASQLVRDTV